MEGKMQDVPISKIQVITNVRIRTDTGIPELMDSIKQHGLKQPIGVYTLGNDYVLIWGDRRLGACKKLGWTTIPSRVYDKISDQDHIILNMVENVQRKDISPIELGRLCYQLKKMGLNNSEIAARLSVAKPKIEYCMRLYRYVPKKHRGAIEFRTDKQKPYGIAATNASKIVTSFSHKRITEEQKDELFDVVKKKQYSSRQLNVLLQLVHELGIKEAVKKLDEYALSELRMYYKKEEMNALVKKYRYNKTKILRKIINGDIPRGEIVLMSG